MDHEEYASFIWNKMTFESFAQIWSQKILKM